MFAEHDLDIESRFEDFIKNYQDIKGKYIYRETLKELPAKGLISLVIDFDDLLRYDPELGKQIIDNPAECFEEGSNAIKSVLKIIDAEYAESVRKFFIRIKNLPSTLPLRKIRAQFIGKLIQVSGILTRASKVQPLLVEGTFQCRHCGTKMQQEQIEGRYTPPAICINQTCRRKGPFTLIEEESHFIDLQHVRIQESPEELPAGQLPRFVDALLKADIVDIARPGDRVTIVGILKAVPEKGQAGKPATFRTFIETSYIEAADKEIEEIVLSKEEEEKIKELAKDPLISEKLINSIAPSIYGHKEVKEAIALMLFGGVKKVLPDGVTIRGDINILLVGDPGTGKSQLLKYVTRIAPRAIYTTGKGSTAAGLTAAVVQDAMTGGLTLEAGALVLADRGIACIDEFDKMRKEDRGAIHEAMEQQTISIAKAGIVATLNARTSILAAANPAFGRYDVFKTAAENLTLPVTILSRFDLIFVLTDKPDAKTDKDMVRHILNLHHKPKEIAVNIIPIDLLKKYIVYAKRNVTPRLSPEAIEEIETFYLGMRMKSSASSAVAITARQLEALVRLAEAHARMELRDVVEKRDAQVAIRLALSSLRQVAFDETTSTIDIDRVLVGKPRTQMEQIQRIFEIVTELERERGDAIPVTKVIELAEQEGIARNFAKKAIEHLRNEGMLFEPRPGFVKKA